MDDGKDWLEAILKRKAYNESPIKVVELNEGDSAPGKGENYLSKIQKLKVKVLLGSGKTKTISVLVKCEHETEHMKKLSSEGGLFVREIMMYRDILPKMEELLEGISDPDGGFWPKCYDIRLYNRLVFEDLSGSGFRMVNRLNQLSLNAALTALKHFAKFHALSRILLDRGEIPMDIFGKNIWIDDNNPKKIEYTRMMINSNKKNMVEKMEKWGDEWNEAIERLKNADILGRFIDEWKPSPDEFNVLCHCDAWPNNMMFKGEDLENPTSFRLLDLQVCSVNSPAKDLEQFLLTSVRLEDRIQHEHLLLQTYLDTLNSYLLKLGYEGELLTLENLKTALARKGAVRLCDAMGFIPIVLGQAEHAPDFEQTMKDYNEAKERGEEKAFEGFSMLKHLTPVAEAIIKHEIKEAMKSGVI